MTWSPAFSRAFARLLVFTLTFHWTAIHFVFQLLVVAEGEIQKQQKYYVGFISGLSRDFR